MRRVSTYTSSATTQDIQMLIASWVSPSWVDIDTTQSVWTSGNLVSVTKFVGVGGSQNGTIFPAGDISLDNLNWMFWDPAGSNVLTGGTTITLPSNLVGKVVAVRKQIIQYGSVDAGQPTWGTIDFLTADIATAKIVQLTPTVVWDAAALETAAAAANSRAVNTTVTAIGRVTMPSYIIFAKSTQDPRGAAVDCRYTATTTAVCSVSGACGQTGFNTYSISGWRATEYDGAACPLYHGVPVTGNGTLNVPSETCSTAACPCIPNNSAVIPQKASDCCSGYAGWGYCISQADNDALMNAN